MEKSTKILICSIVMTFFSTESHSQNNEIIVDISEQRLYLYNNDNLVQSFPVSTSKYGEGQIENSFKTPLGLHEIKEKIGDKAPINTIFTARENTKKRAEILINSNDTEDDFVTSRILWP